MKLTLWTIQDEQGWNELKNRKKLIPKVNFVDKDFLRGYDWMKLEMKNRIIHSNKKNNYPVWSWYHCTDETKKKTRFKVKWTFRKRKNWI